MILNDQKIIFRQKWGMRKERRGMDQRWILNLFSNSLEFNLLTYITKLFLLVCYWSIGNHLQTTVMGNKHPITNPHKVLHPLWSIQCNKTNQYFVIIKILLISRLYAITTKRKQWNLALDLDWSYQKRNNDYVESLLEKLCNC